MTTSFPIIADAVDRMVSTVSSAVTEAYEVAEQVESDYERRIGFAAE